MSRARTAPSVTALLLALGLAGCGGGSTTTATSETATGTATSSSSATSTTSASPTAPTSGGSATANPNTPVGDSFAAFGTEPFWQVTVNGTALEFDDVSTGEKRSLTATRSDSGTSTVYGGDNNGTSFTLTVTPGACNDGMSDNTYPWTSTFVYGEASFTGCANPH
jgi:uncharacterized membrane protein